MYAVCSVEIILQSHLFMVAIKENWVNELGEPKKVKGLFGVRSEEDGN